MATQGNKTVYIEQKIGNIDEPLLTVRPRYVADQINGVRGRRSRFRLISPTSSKNIRSTGITQALREELSPSGKGFTSMLIQNVSYGMMEKTQITETFGDSITVYAFGMAPIVLNIQGVVVDDLDNNWFVKLIHVYKDHIRATKLAKHFEIARLDMPDASYIGSVLALNINRDSSNDAIVGFNMQFLVRNHQFFSTQPYDKAALDKEKPLEQVGKDGSFPLKSLKDKKAWETSLKKLGDGIAGSAADKAKNFAMSGLNSSLESVGNSAFGQKSGLLGNLGLTQVNKVASKALDKEFNKQFDRHKGSFGIKDMFSKGLGSSITGSALTQSRTYTLRVIGAYSSELVSADGNVDVVGQFIDGITVYVNNTDETIRAITGQGGGTVQDAIDKKKSLTNTFNIGKKILDLAKGKTSLNIDSIGELGSIGASLKGTLGKVAGLPTTLSDKLGGLIQNSPLSQIPFVGSLLGGVAADQAEKYLRTKIPTKASDFLKIPAQEPTKSRVIRVGLGPLAELL